MIRILIVFLFVSSIAQCQFSVEDLIGICKMDYQSFYSLMIKKGFQSMQKHQPENIESLNYINLKEPSKCTICMNNEEISKVKLSKNKNRCRYKTYKNIQLKTIKELKALGFTKHKNKRTQLPTTVWKIDTYYRGNIKQEQINIMIRLGAKNVSENEIHLIYSD